MQYQDQNRHHRLSSNMRRGLYSLACALIIPISVFAYTSPGKPQGFVNDFARVFSTEQQQSLESTVSALKTASGFELAIVTVPTLGGDTVENYANKLFQEWGIGQKGKDNGILVLIAVNDRQMRIETGYGSEGALTDLQAGNIIRTVFTPEFKNGNYYLGVWNGVHAIATVLMKSPEAAQYSMSPSSQSSSSSKLNGHIIFFLIVIGLNILSYVLGKTKSWWLGGVLGAGIGGVLGVIYGFFYVGLVSVIVLTLLGLLFDYIVSNKRPGSGGGGFWFFGGGSGGSGGFGGFGGGSCFWRRRIVV